MLDASNAIHPQLQEEMNLDNTELERAVEQVDCCCFILSCISCLSLELVYFIGELSDRTYRLGSVTNKTKGVKLNCLI